MRTMDTNVLLRIPAAEKRMLAEAARARGLTLSALLRDSAAAVARQAA